MKRAEWPAAYGLACTQDGRLLATVGGRYVVVIDLNSRDRLSSSPPLSHPSSVAFASNDEALAVKSTSGHIIVLNAQTGELIADHKNKKDGEGSNIVCTPDGQHLIDGSWNGSFTLRHLLTGRIVSRDELPGEMITRITHDQHARLWLVEHGLKVRPGENMLPPDYVSVSEWPFSSLQSGSILQFERHMRGSTISPDGTRLCFVDQHRNELCVARTDTREMLAIAPLQLGGTGCDLAWSNDARIIGAVADMGFRFFRASDLEPVGSYAASYPSSVMFHPNGCDVLLGTWRTSMAQPLANICDLQVVLH